MTPASPCCYSAGSGRGPGDGSRLAQIDRRARGVSARGWFPDPGLFRVHAAAAHRNQTLRMPWNTNRRSPRMIPGAGGSRPGSRHTRSRPGLPLIGRQIVETMISLATGRRPHRIGHYHLEDNPYWPECCTDRLSRMSDMFSSRPWHSRKPRTTKVACAGLCSGQARMVRRGDSGRASFSAPEREIPEADALERIRTILQAVYGIDRMNCAI